MKIQSIAFCVVKPCSLVEGLRINVSEEPFSFTPCPETHVTWNLKNTSLISLILNLFKPVSSFDEIC
jgi:hypothetical protein